MLILVSVVFFFFFKQKTAYEMRISDWSSDVCSSDLRYHRSDSPTPPAGPESGASGYLRPPNDRFSNRTTRPASLRESSPRRPGRNAPPASAWTDRKSVV